MNKELQQWIADYDSGKKMESVNMGGMGDGYEAAIQICAVEAIRTLKDLVAPEDTKEFSDAVESAAERAVDKLDAAHGFSGAQVGAAKNIAAVFWRQTPSVGIEKMRSSNPERIILISKLTDLSVQIG